MPAIEPTPARAPAFGPFFASCSAVSASRRELRASDSPSDADPLSMETFSVLSGSGACDVGVPWLQPRRSASSLLVSPLGPTSTARVKAFRNR